MRVAEKTEMAPLPLSGHQYTTRMPKQDRDFILTYEEETFNTMLFAVFKKLRTSEP